MSKLDEARAAVERLRKRFSIRSDGVPLDLDLIATGLDEAERRAEVAEEALRLQHASNTDEIGCANLLRDYWSEEYLGVPIEEQVELLVPLLYAIAENQTGG